MYAHNIDHDYVGSEKSQQFIKISVNFWHFSELIIESQYTCVVVIVVVIMVVYSSFFRKNFSETILRKTLYEAL